MNASDVLEQFLFLELINKRLASFDMFKIGIGPSSSHTLGPMKAGKAFVDELKETELFEHVTRVQANVYGSLSLTGIGHSTDKAIGGVSAGSWYRGYGSVVLPVSG